jgi:hypothetical protein
MKPKASPGTLEDAVLRRVDSSFRKAFQKKNEFRLDTKSRIKIARYSRDIVRYIRIKVPTMTMKDILAYQTGLFKPLQLSSLKESSIQLAFLRKLYHNVRLAISTGVAQPKTIRIQLIRDAYKKHSLHSLYSHIYSAEKIKRPVSKPAIGQTIEVLRKQGITLLKYKNKAWRAL